METTEIKEMWLHFEKDDDLGLEDWYKVCKVSNRNMWDAGQNIKVITYSEHLSQLAKLDGVKTENLELKLKLSNMVI